MRSGLQSRVRRFDSDPRLQELDMNQYFAISILPISSRSRQRPVLPWTQVVDGEKTR
jgi:hypothetical protein